HDAILTGIGTVLADDCRLTDRTGLERPRPLMRIVLDSQLRIPTDSKIVQSTRQDLTVATTSAASTERRKQLTDLGVQVLAFDGKAGRVSLEGVIGWLASRKCLSLMVEAGSKVNWAFVAANAADKILFYYAPKIMGGMTSLPVVGGKGRMRRVDAIDFENVNLISIPPDEFIVEAYLVKKD
ncbi:MAG: riboflavin biosynthesis protein RibD, partial [bacterium]|nr:riboflavin biosynthesis protein RibD [bacterium]